MGMSYGGWVLTVIIKIKITRKREKRETERERQRQRQRQTERRGIRERKCSGEPKRAKRIGKLYNLL